MAETLSGGGGFACHCPFNETKRGLPRYLCLSFFFLPAIKGGKSVQLSLLPPTSPHHTSHHHHHSPSTTTRSHLNLSQSNLQTAVAGCCISKMKASILFLSIQAIVVTVTTAFHQPLHQRLLGHNANHYEHPCASLSPPSLMRPHTTQLFMAKKRNVTPNKRTKQKKKQQSIESLLELETDLHSRGYSHIIGSDDSGGAGCIAGPVVVASCCILKPFSSFLSIPSKTSSDDPSEDCLVSSSEMEILSQANDCKELTTEQRLEIFTIIHSHPEIFAITTAQRSPQQIDEINLTRATQEAFAESIETLVEQNNLPTEKDKVYAIVDGKVSPKLYASQRIQTDSPDEHTPFESFSVRPYVNGDANVYTVALSSIIARVKHEEVMRELNELYPEYGFANHSGYGRKDHIEALHRLGSLEGVHRMSFKQVKGR